MNVKVIVIGLLSNVKLLWRSVKLRYPIKFGRISPCSGVVFSTSIRISKNPALCGACRFDACFALWQPSTNARYSGCVLQFEGPQSSFGDWPLSAGSP